jgi:hypothetical protein
VLTVTTEENVSLENEMKNENQTPVSSFSND